MKYANREMKIDQIIGYFNEKKINLIPPFQRGTVWKLPLRRKLIENMVQSRPIPAISSTSKTPERNSTTTFSMVSKGLKA